MRLAVALGRRVPVVKMGEKRPIRRAEILPVEAVGVEVEIVLEANTNGSAVFGVNHRAGEGPVERIPRALRQVRVVTHLHDAVRGAPDRPHLALGDAVFRSLHPDVIVDRRRQVRDDGVRGAGPKLMRSCVRKVGPSRAVPETILVAFFLTRVDDRGTLVRCPARPRVPCVGIERAVRPAPTRSHRLRNRHALFPRFEDQRAERHLFSYATARIRNAGNRYGRVPADRAVSRSTSNRRCRARDRRVLQPLAARHPHVWCSPVHHVLLFSFSDKVSPPAP